MLLATFSIFTACFFVASFPLAYFFLYDDSALALNFTFFASFSIVSSVFIIFLLPLLLYSGNSRIRSILNVFHFLPSYFSQLLGFISVLSLVQSLAPTTSSISILNSKFSPPAFQRRTFPLCTSFSLSRYWRAHRFFGNRTRFFLRYDAASS